MTMKKLIFIPVLFLSTLMLQAQSADTTIVRLEIDSLIKLSDSLSQAKDHEQAVQVIKMAEEKCLSTFGEKTALYGLVAFNVGRIYRFKRDFKKAEKFYLKAVEIQEQTIGKENEDYGWTMNNLGSLYWHMGEYEKARPYWIAAKEVRGKVFGKESYQYAAALNNLGVLYDKLGEYEKVEPYYVEATEIRRKVFGEKHRDYGLSLSNMANFYFTRGGYEKSEPMFLKSTEILKEALGEEAPYYLRSLRNLYGLYMRMGNFEKAENYLLKAKKIWDKKEDKNNHSYALLLFSLGDNYYQIGNYDRAEPYFIESSEILAKVTGEQHSHYASVIQRLSYLYQIVGKMEEAEKLLLKVKDIREKALGKENYEYGLALVALGNFYQRIENFDEAENYFNLAKDNLAHALGREHQDYALCLRNLGTLYEDIENYQEAESYFLEAKALRAKILGTKHPDYADNCYDLARLYFLMGDNEKALKYFEEVDDIKKKHLINASRHLSETELAGYIQEFSKFQNVHFSFAQANLAYAPEAFNNLLFYKGFLLSTVGRTRNLALSNPESLEKFNELKANYRLLATQLSYPLEDQDRVKELEEKVNTQEKELVKDLAGFQESTEQVVWKDILEKLAPGEAVIEFIHYNFFNPKHTEKVMYSAMVLKPGASAPKLIPLFEEKELESLLQKSNARRWVQIKKLYEFSDSKAEKCLSDLIWKPLEQELNGIATIYFSPSGLLNRINLGAIEIDAQSIATEKYKLIQVNSSRQLAYEKDFGISDNIATLYGGIQYELDTLNLDKTGEGQLYASRGLSVPIDYESATRGETWKYLKYTKEEVQENAKILQTANFNVSLKMEASGTEESFKQLAEKGKTPRVLHLATHGFFYPDPELINTQEVSTNSSSAFIASDNPMIRSGLILAGGNYVWKGNAPVKDREDGILTAFEISQMDLSNTELVVLSACETGLGEIEGNEGVYGLQRAFKIAGAKYLIMSLWQVPDLQTKELMATFYSKWLEENLSIPEAFQLAQNEMKANYPNPYFWAGFILVQ